MSARRRAWARWLGRGLAVLAAFAVLSLLSAVLVLGTASGRARVLEELLARVNASIPGRLEVERLERLGPFGVTLAGVRLLDPAATTVLSVSSVRVELAPLELLQRRIVVPLIELGTGQVDLRDLDVPGRGLSSAWVAPGAPPAPEDAAPLPYVRVDELVVRGWSVIAPRLPHPWDELRVRELTASARVELDGAPDVTLRSLAAEVSRAERPLLRLTQVALHLARPGAASDVALSAELGAARLSASARGVLPPSPAAEASPLAAELQLSGLRAEDLALLLDDGALESAFAGPVELVASASGTLARLVLAGRLSTAAGALELRSELRGKRELDVGVSGRALDLSRLRADLPAAPLSLELEASVAGSTPGRVPFELRLRSGKLGEQVLPVLASRGTWNGASFEDVVVELTKGRSLIRVEGDVDPRGAFELGLSAALRPEELEDWAVAAGLPRPPRGMLGAELRLARGLDGTLALRGGVRARSIRLPDLSVDAATVDVDLTGRPLALRGSARASVVGLTRGPWRAPRLAVTLEAGPTGYRVRGNGVVDRLRAAIDVWVRADGAERFVVRGGASGEHGGHPFELSVEPTTLHRQGWLSTRGIELRAGGQALQLTGDYGRPRSELVLRAPALDLATLAELARLGPDWRGRGQLTLRLKGRPEAPVLDALLEASELSRAGARAVRARVALRLDAEAGRAEVAADVSSDTGPSWLAATFALRSDFGGGAGWHERWREARHRAALDLKRLDLAGIEPWIGRPLPGSAELSLSATLDGTLARPVLHATLAAALRDAFGLSPLKSEQRLDYAQGKLSYGLGVDDAVGRWLSASAELELPAEAARDLLALSGRWGELVDRARFRVELDAARRRLGTLWLEAPAAVAGLEVGGTLRLTHEAGAEPAGQASLHVSEAPTLTAAGGCAHAGVVLALDAELARRRLAATLTARHRGSELLRLSSGASVELGQALRGGAATLGAVSAELTSRALELENVPYLCQRLRGRLDASVRLVDVLGSEPSLTGDVTATGLSLGAEPRLDVQLSARADHDDASATLTIRAPRGRSLLRAQVPVRWSSGRFTLAADAPLSASARLDALPIAPLLDPAGALSYASGTLHGQVDVAGTVSAPEPSGRLELRDAELTATALAQPLHDVRGRLAFNRNALWIEHFEAHDRDGVLELSGKVERRGVDALALALDMTAKSFPLRQRGQVVATMSGQATIDASLEGGRSRVAIRLANADTWLEKVQVRSGIDLRAHPDFVVVGAPDAAAGPTAASSQGASTTESHIRLDATDHFWIKREDFAVQLSTRLDAVIVGERTKIKGRVDIHRGYLDLMGRVFDVDRNSRLEFTGTSTPDPVVAIVATYEQRSSGQTVKVQIGGRGSKPTLTFYIDDAEVSIDKALKVLVGRRGSADEDWAKKDATSFVSGLTAGLLATSARRELGAAAPIIMIEPGDQTGEGRIRAGFELDALVPQALRRLITGVYVEGIVEREGAGNDGSQGQQSSTQAGVLVELYFPHQLFSTGQWGPGTTWSLDWGWQL